MFLQKYQKHHIWNQEQKLPRGSDTGQLLVILQHAHKNSNPDNNDRQPLEKSLTLTKCIGLRRMKDEAPQPVLHRSSD